MKYRLFAMGALVLALTLLLSLPPAFASVELVYFRAAAQADDTILVTWESATERDTVGYNLYRSESAAPADWGSPIVQVPARGDALSGADYAHVDSTVTAGIKYYYVLRELSATGTVDFGPISAGIGIATDTPTATVTATGTSASAATATRIPTWTGFPTATQPAPTATRRFTETPVVPTQPAAPTRAAGVSTSPLRPPTRTPLAGARVATPTGLAPRVTLPAPVLPTPSPTVSLLSQVSPLLPTLKVPTLQPTLELDTATPRPTKEVTPVIFQAEPRTGSEETQSSEVVAGQGSRNASLALIIGGSAIGVAGLLAAVLLFLRSRRS